MCLALAEMNKGGGAFQSKIDGIRKGKLILWQDANRHEMMELDSIIRLGCCKGIHEQLLVLRGCELHRTSEDIDHHAAGLP